MYLLFMDANAKYKVNRNTLLISVTERDDVDGIKNANHGNAHVNISGVQGTTTSPNVGHVVWQCKMH